MAEVDNGYIFERIVVDVVFVLKMDGLSPSKKASFICFNGRPSEMMKNAISC